MTEQADASLVPPDFPRRGASALSGAHPKIGVRLMDGKFVAGETEEELGARYEACRDLVTQLTSYALRKQAEHPDQPIGELLRRVRAAVVRKGWGIDVGELHWVMQQVALGVGGVPADAPNHDIAIPTSRADTPDHAHVESIVDLALSMLAVRDTRSG